MSERTADAAPTVAELVEEYSRRSLASDGAGYAIAAALLVLADKQDRTATWLKHLGTGDAAGTMGAIEFLGTVIAKGLKAVASAQSDGAERLADAIDGLPR